MDKLLNYPGLMELGLRLMSSAEGNPGAPRGPSFFGAVGQAGLGQMASDQARAQRDAAAAAATAKFEEEKRQFGVEQATENRKIDADLALKEATLAVRRSTEAARNEIQLYRADLARRGQELDESQLAVRIDELQANELDDLRGSEAYENLLYSAESDEAGQKAQKQLEAEVNKKWDRVRTREGIPRSDEGEKTSKTKPGQGIPKVGAIEDGYKFKGGDPSNPESWEKVNP
jgi:hypothetical protein